MRSGGVGEPPRTVLKRAEELATVLACPACHSGIHNSDGYRCTNSACRLNREGFPTIRGQPVLLRSAGVVSPEILEQRGGASHIDRRRSWLTQRVRRSLLDGAAVQQSRAMAQRLVELLAPLPRPRVLIVGGGEVGMGSEVLYEDTRLDAVSFDVYQSDSTSFVGDAHSIPMLEGTVDAVWIQYVLEHVLDPPAVVEEIRRVLRPAGLVYAATPFLQPVHEGAFDFTRYTHSGHRWLFRWFEEIDSGVVMGPGPQLLSTIEYWTRGVTRSRTAGKALKLLFSWMRFFERLIPTAYALDNASALYFLGRRSVTPMSEADIREYYRGADGR